MRVNISITNPFLSLILSLQIRIAVRKNNRVGYKLDSDDISGISLQTGRLICANVGPIVYLPETK